MKTELTDIIAKIKNGTVQVTPEDSLLKKLARNKPLKIKFGMDPTAPDLHLGHAVVLCKLRELQDMGHEIIYLIGDYTTRIGDPTGRSKTRPSLTEQEIAENAKTYFNQVSKILDPAKTIIKYNSQWLSKLSFADLIQLCAKVTVAQLIQREDFAQRLQENTPISVHELLYPIMQGYDSVELKADLELGGTDQTFNLLMGRHLQECYQQEPQVIMTMPLLEGLDGVKKMSKSMGNYVGLWEDASTAYGKLMSISDQLMWRYYHLLLSQTPEQIVTMQQEVTNGSQHPMKLKKEMAKKIITRFWSEADGQKAQANFEALFQKQDYSQAKEVVLDQGTANPIWIVDLLKLFGAINSSSDAKRLIEGKGLEIDGVQVTDFKAQIAWKSGMIVKAGKIKVYKIK
jgi:tyrosyl-tRNA synthetase